MDGVKKRKPKFTSFLTNDSCSDTSETQPNFERQYSGNLDDTDSFNFTTPINYSEYVNNESPYILTDKIVDEATITYEPYYCVHDQNTSYIVIKLSEFLIIYKPCICVL